MRVIGDAEEAAELERGIRNCILNINQSLKSIQMELIRTGAGWNDEGYRQVNQSVMDVIASITRHMDDISDLLTALKEYEQILRGTGAAGIGLAAGTAGGQAGAGQKKSGIPNSYAATQETWKQTEDGIVYDSPVEMRAKLDLNQGKVFRFKGTCGLCSCENVLRLAGVEITEAEVVKYAAKNKLCEFHFFRRAAGNGGTSAENRQEILRHFGLESEQVPSSVENIAQAVSEGRGVIVSVYATRLWHNSVFKSCPHAVTVTSVKKDEEGNVLGFYVADSGIHGKDKDGYYPRYRFEMALTGRPLNVTSQIIR